VFFVTREARNDAAAATTAASPGVRCTAIEVSDENWAERSQASLEPVSAGRVVVLPREELRSTLSSTGDDIVIVIRPSMGFGTGHHASTRLCLRLLQQRTLAGASVIDVGTGSGLLAIAARKLGAGDAVAIDIDHDALQSASENIDLNGEQAHIGLEAVDLAVAPSQLDRVFDLVLANLTAAVIVRYAGALAEMTAAAGRLIVSGIQPHEFEEVASALGRHGLALASRLDEADWVGAEFARRGVVTSPRHSTGR
jgi:ribosomal protein L11 methyltransferase